MFATRLKKIVAGLQIFTARLISVSYADHPAAGDQAFSGPSQSQAYLSLPPGR